MRLLFSLLALAVLTLFSVTKLAIAQNQIDRPRYEKIAPATPIDAKEMQALAAAGAALPTWTATFSYQQIPFSYTMIGTNPSKGSATTSVQFVLIPIVMHFSDGTILDPTKTVQCNGTSSALELTEQSPLFADTVEYKQGGTDIGTTQYLDAFQRAEFWSVVSKSAANYHVLIAAPVVTAAQTITVPANEGSTVKGSCGVYGKVNMSWFDGQLRTILTNLGSQITKATVAYALTYDVVDTDPACCVLGYHSVSSTGVVYGTGTYNDENAFNTDLDVVPTSHELAEIFNDPFIGNYTPNWTSSIAPQYGCSDLLEVGDPVVGIDEAITVPGVSHPFHVQDLAFQPWFANAPTSTSVNGWYTMFNSLTKVSASSCEIHTYQFHAINVPGATSTQAFGINNQDEIVGTYANAVRGQNGFLLSGNQFTTINCALESGTLLSNINNNGAIVGTYATNDAGAVVGFIFEGNNSCSPLQDPNGLGSTNLWGQNDKGVIAGFYTNSGGAFQGFTESAGKFTPINCSGATDTRAYGIGNTGVVLGDYEDSAGGDFNGLLFSGGKCNTVNFPGAASTSTKGINASGQIAGWYNNGAFHGFVKSGTQFVSLDFPGATNTLAFHINDRGQVVGWYEDATGVHGFLATPRHEEAP